MKCEFQKKKGFNFVFWFFEEFFGSVLLGFFEKVEQKVQQKSGVGCWEDERVLILILGTAAVSATVSESSALNRLHIAVLRALYRSQNTISRRHVLHRNAGRALNRAATALIIARVNVESYSPDSPLLPPPSMTYELTITLGYHGVLISINHTDNTSALRYFANLCGVDLRTVEDVYVYVLAKNRSSNIACNRNGQDDMRMLPIDKAIRQRRLIRNALRY